MTEVDSSTPAGEITAEQMGLRAAAFPELLRQRNELTDEITALRAERDAWIDRAKHLEDGNGRLMRDREAMRVDLAVADEHVRSLTGERDAMRGVVDAGRALEEVHRCEGLSVDGEPGGCLCRWCELRLSIEFVDALHAAPQGCVCNTDDGTRARSTSVAWDRKD